ncbi:MAG: thiamine-phosphate kinase [Methanocellales archaeon]|nr:thiamine-phosphate kinase [Methanocellales archaeon]MDD3421697.1 thiamine-phosphate kinase [Methanocellales archaeon]MDD5446629.1 thiamine-phosphate kinase [Methanocellales archaeon]
MKIKDMGERALVARISKSLPHNVVLSAGEDDCAVLDWGDDYLLLTTDMLHQSTDFPDKMTPWQIGWMSVAVNLSDIAAMGARPLAIVTALGFPADTEVSFVDEIIEGMNFCARKFSTNIVGGDTDEHKELTIVGTALGCIKKDDLLRRSGAQIGDLVCVTGELGTAEAGFQAINMNLSEDVKDVLTKKLFEPQPRVSEGIALAKSGVVTSMMDISDGLALSLYDLSASSNIGFMIYGDRIPILDETRVVSPNLELPLYGGGDFELLFTAEPEGIEKAQKACNLTVIGEVASSDILIKENGFMSKIKAKGHEYFRV